VSFAHTFDTPTAASLHHTQYFEMLGHRAIYNDGWRAVCPWPGPSFTEAGVGVGQPISAQTLSELDGGKWELYHLEEDFAENHNVAADNRDKLIELIATWYVEAGKYGVMPIDGSGLERMIAEKPAAAPPRDSYTYLPNTQSVPFFAGPRVLNRPHSITATVDIPDGGAEGVLLCQGTAAGGYSLFVKTAGCTTSTTTSAAACTASHRPTRYRPERTNCASSSSRPASRTCHTDAAHRDDCSSTSTAPSSQTPTHQ
jgi:arylsulfatase